MHMTRELLEQSLIGKVVKRISAKHGEPEVRKMARSIVEKWREEVTRQHHRDQREERRGRGPLGAGGRSVGGGNGGGGGGGGGGRVLGGAAAAGQDKGR